MAAQNPSVGLSLFGLKILSSLLPSAPLDKNVFISPLSIVTALTMAEVGSQEGSEVQKELLSAIGIGDEKTLVEGVVGPALRHAGAASSGAGAEVRMANSVWSNGIKKEYINMLQQVFGAHAVDHINSEEINAWVSEATKGKIQKLVGQLSPDTAAVLVNAIFFRGLWEESFDKKETRPAEFALENGTTKQVPMMHLKAAQRRYAALGGGPPQPEGQSNEFMMFEKDTGAQAMALPYKGGRHHCIIILPPEGVKLNDYINTLGGTEGGLLNVIDQLKETKAELWMPRLKVEYEQDLVGVFQSFGLKQSFGLTPQWSRMADQPLAISNIIHKAVIELDEEGTTAAAATAVIMTRSISMHPRMNLNRPFIVVLWDEQLKLPLFVGGIRNPGA